MVYQCNTKKMYNNNIKTCNNNFLYLSYTILSEAQIKHYRIDHNTKRETNWYTQKIHYIKSTILILVSRWKMSKKRSTMETIERQHLIILGLFFPQKGDLWPY